ncbi:MAG: hypothetical protein A2297_02625 [Elusimicrobia bacterium RIFOXYB2_FULL_48_7]|nr:MAG: hypothetical protein A2297_02625 [Elusimicrobia bacterium RIFOXYB2_FULL_48_7]
MSVPQDISYLERAGEAKAEKLLLGDNADELFVEPAPVTDARFEKNRNFGLIFGAESILIQDTILAFQTDEITSRPSGGPEINILGVHYKWLTDGGRAKRALIVDLETLIVKDVVFSEPVSLDFTQILHLPSSNERQLHETLSQTFSKISKITQLNSYSGVSQRADDKMRAYELLKADGKTVVPATILIKKSEKPESVRGAVKKIAGSISGSIVVQPNTGTEGKNVRKFDAAEAAADYILKNIFLDDDALVREERGNLYCLVPGQEDRGYRRVVLRVNACYNGSGFSAESWYAQVAGDEKSFVTSPSSGGSVMYVDKIAGGFYYKTGQKQVKSAKFAKFALGAEEIKTITDTVAECALAVNAGLDEKTSLKMMGIDIIPEIKLEAGELKLLPVVLDINPRPAGLARLREISAAGSNPAPMISHSLFTWLRSK